MGRFIQFAIAAAEDAIAQSGLKVTQKMPSASEFTSAAASADSK